MTEIKIKRAYDAPSQGDGFRILVDRLWPRGLIHDRLDCQLWAKDIAPSAELREWFHADIAGRWREFEEKYRAELMASPDFRQFVKTVESHPVVTFVFASRDVEHNEAAVLQKICTGVMEGR